MTGKSNMKWKHRSRDTSKKNEKSMAALSTQKYWAANQTQGIQLNLRAITKTITNPTPKTPVKPLRSLSNP
jgi:hypothetical protein